MEARSEAGYRPRARRFAVPEALARGPYFARNRDAANMEVHATVLPRGHCGFIAQFTARRGRGLGWWGCC
jgi:hypothetical protein